MKLSNLETTRYPVVYIAIGFLWSSIIFAYSKKSLGLVLFLTGLFLCFISFRESREFALVMLLVLSIGIMVNRGFYNLEINGATKARVIKSYGKMAIVEVKGRKIRLIGELSEVIEGEEVLVKGEFKKEINYEKGEIGTLKIKEIKVVKDSIFTKLTAFKEYIKKKLRKNIGKRKEALVTSIIFGKNSDLDEEDKEDMTNLGVIHAMSVSGLHIAIIFTVLKKILGVKMAIVVSFMYVLITGLGFSSLRAFIMMVMLSISFIVKKTNNSIASLAFSSLIIFFWKPCLIFDVGFQLSYGATLGIILFNKKINDKLYKLNNLLRDTISIALAAQVFVFPLLIIYFNSFSMIFLLGNLLLIPVINLILFVGIGAIVFSYVSPVFDFLSYILLKLVEALDFLARGISYLDIGSIYIGEAVGYFYIFTVMCLYLYYRGINKAKYLPIPYMIFLFFKIYSPMPTIEYRREGAIIVSFCGEKAIMTSNKNLDKNEIIKKTGGKIIKSENLNIGEMASIRKMGADFVLKVGDEEYYLNMSNGKNQVEYDIINFKDGKEKKLLILKDKAVVIE